MQKVRICMKLKTICLVTVTLLILTLPFSTAHSHPHVFIYTTVEAVFDKDGLAGFHLYWKFDEMFSTLRINDYDRNGNGEFEKNELQALEKGAFSNLKKSDYFSHVTIGGKEFKVQYVTEFHAWIKDSIVYYSFRIPCHVKANEREKTVKLSVYDPSFYCSVFLTDNPVSFKHAQKFDTGCKVERNKQKAYYYGQVYPEEITVTFRDANG
mgnify:FL=1